MNNDQLAANWSDNHLEPVDEFVMEAWNGGEIYRGEEYLEFYNGSIVLNEKDELLEYIKENWDEFYEEIRGMSDLRVAE